MPTATQNARVTSRSLASVRRTATRVANHAVIRTAGLATVAALISLAEIGAQAVAPTPGVLRLAPAIPRAGQPVQVSYDASPSLAGRKALVLRAAVFGGAGAGRDLSALTLATLTPSTAGKFKGQFVAPANATLLRMAVETESGDATDRNGDGYFDAVLAGADGRPNYDGLWWSAVWARVRATAAGGSAVVTLRARIDSVATLYPERAGGWRLRATGTASTAERDERASRVVALDQRLAKEATPNLADANELANMADEVGRGDVATKWRDRIIADSLRTDPVSRNVWYLEASRRAAPAMARGEATPLLVRAVGQWQSSAATTLNLRLTESGVRMALSALDTGKARLWYDRCGAACTLSFPATAKGAVLDFLIGRAQRIRGTRIIGSERPLGITLAEAAAVDTSVRARLVAGHAELLTAAARLKDAAAAREALKALAPDGASRSPVVEGLVFSARAHLAMVARKG